MFGLEAYFQALAHQHKITHLYVGSDDQNIINQASQEDGHVYDIHTLDHPAQVGGYIHRIFEDGPIEGLRDLTMLDLLISTYGTALSHITFILNGCIAIAITILAINK